MESTSGNKRERKANFVHEEINILVDEVQNSKDILFGCFSSTLDNQRKSAQWEKITNKINAVSIQRRTKEQIKKKWQDIQGSAKKKESFRRKEMRLTGGGLPPKDLTELEKKVISIIPDSLIQGIKGGSDSFGPAKISLTPKDVPMDMTEASPEPTEDAHVATASTCIWQSDYPLGAESSTCSAKEVLQSSSSADTGKVQTSSARKESQTEVPLSCRSADTLKIKSVGARRESQKDVSGISTELLEIEKRKLRIMEQLLQIEKDKLEILRGISSPSACLPSIADSLCVSPIIKFL